MFADAVQLKIKIMHPSAPSVSCYSTGNRDTNRSAYEGQKEEAVINTDTSHSSHP
jgi:hypothetical protein